MPPTLCPYLGVEDDPETALEFPSAGNYCYHARPVEQVRTAHQSAYCLTSGHTSCPVYQRATLAPLPPRIAARPPIAAPTGAKVMIGALIAVLLIGAFLFLGGWNKVVAMLNPGSPASIPLTGGALPTPFQPGGTFTPTPGDNALLFAFTASPFPTRAECPLPAGWMPYIVNPTDSLALLSLMYNVPVEQLRAVNCLAVFDFLKPGEVIYIPFVPTQTPTPPAPGIPVTQVTRLPLPTSPIFVLPGPNPTPTRTFTPFPSATAFWTPIPTATLFPTALPSSTLFPTLTSTLRPTFPVFPTATPVTPTGTATQPLPTRTPRRQTRTPIPTATWTPIPTATPVPPTATSVPPTATFTQAPPTSTDVPPTPTDVPPTATDVPPPTATSPPPTAFPTPILVTEVPAPTDAPTEVPTAPIPLITTQTAP